MLDGSYKEGDLLPSERELMDQFGVGRPAIREAMLSLAKRGFVSVSSGERTRVTRPTAAFLVREMSTAVQFMLAEPEGVRHFQQARLIFESGIARLAAQDATDDDLRALEEALENNRAAIGHPTDFERTDVEFHYVIASISRNPIFVALHKAAVSWLTEQRTTVLKGPDADVEAFRAHEQIFLGIQRRDPIDAESAMRSHLENVNGAYWLRAGNEPD